MRKLKQIIVAESMQSDDGLFSCVTKMLALDDNGEMWYGEIEETEDGRRVIDWTPVNTPRDGAAFTEPQLSRFDKFEKEAHERLQADAEASGETVPLATEDETDTG